MQIEVFVLVDADEHYWTYTEDERDNQDFDELVHPCREIKVLIEVPVPTATVISAVLAAEPDLSSAITIK